MSKYSINFSQLIGDILIPQKRKTKRLKFILDLLKWVRNIYDDFFELKDELLDQSTVNSQAIVLESYLIDQFGAGITITIHELTNTDAFVKHEDDDDLGFFIVHESQTEGGVYINHQDEDVDLYNFTVNVPASLSADLDQMAAIINKYKLTGSSYQIIES